MSNLYNDSQVIATLLEETKLLNSLDLGYGLIVNQICFSASNEYLACVYIEPD